jgi:hypothetical protein
MAEKSWHLNRRTLLKGAGISLALPWLEAMGNDKTSKELPRRLAAVYFPYGAYLGKKGAQYSNWSFLPLDDGKDFKFTDSNKSMEPFRNEVTFLRGLSHPLCRPMGGHNTADTFLTGSSMKPPNTQNTISVDQVAAQSIGQATRFTGMALSADGGIGEFTRSHTLSYTNTGHPIPSLNKPRQVFERMFVMEKGRVNAMKKKLDNTESALDLLMNHSKDLMRNMGKADKEKMDEYLYSVRSIEQKVNRSKDWLKVPMPKVDASKLKLEADDNNVVDFIRTMYDLMYLAFKTDNCRLATFQIGSMNGATSIAGKFPSAIGLGPQHKIAHGAGKSKGAEFQGKWNQFLFEHLAYFMKRLKDTKEGGTSLLDRTTLVFGSSNSKTHAGGKELGFKHGQTVSYSSSVPMNNLLLTMLNRVTPGHKSFGDSTGELSELV